jgi:hypothetical protein
MSRGVVSVLGPDGVVTTPERHRVTVSETGSKVLAEGHDT